jgi:cytochrome c-type biogenesis protein CcmH/NrfF
MLRRSLLSSLFFLPAASLLKADMAGGDPRLSKLFGMFIAPCCWRENLLVHHSPKADELRAEIQGCLKKGWSDQQIQAKLVDAYTRRILSMPEGTQGQLLSWAPWAATLTGGALVCWLIRGSIQAKSAAENGPVATLPDLDLDLE